MRIFSGRLSLPPRLDVSCRGCSHSPRGERPSPEKANSVPLIQANVIWGTAHTVESGKCGYNRKFMEIMTTTCVFPLKSECTFYQSEIFSEQRYREALHTAIGDRMT
jgi:hypothetical protein